MRTPWITLPLLAALAGTRAWAGDNADLEVVHKIKAEAFGNSQVVDYLFYLTDVNGPRLTGSPGFDHAADWTLQKVKSWGLTNAHLEPWGPFGRGWQFSRLDLHMAKPAYAPIHALPLAWCDGTKGLVKGGLVRAPLLREDDNPRELDVATLKERLREYKEKWTGKLDGKFVLTYLPRDFKQPMDADSHRLEDKDLAKMSEQDDLVPIPKPDWMPDRLSGDPKKKREWNRLFAHLPPEAQMEYWSRHIQVYEELGVFLREQGAVAALENVDRASGGILFCEMASRPDGPAVLPTLVVAPEHFNRLWRLNEKDTPVQLELDLAVQFNESPKVANVIAELPGSKKPDEVVMLGGHLDSWHAGTGATDNAAGCAVALEALRILKTLDLKIDRTVRLALWSAEEQGLLGSRAYVREHFADCTSMSAKPEHSRLSAYFNLDNGGGKIRGIYLQENDMVRPMFEAWLAPFKELGAGTVTIQNTLFTDHHSFDAVGLPGFQFIQDPLDYFSRTHHSELDVYDHVEPGDLMQASAIMASFVYHAATREGLLPRKPLPKPLPEKKKPIASLKQ